jgi:hypothetical protein
VVLDGGADESVLVALSAFSPLSGFSAFASDPDPSFAALSPFEPDSFRA